MNFIYKKLKNFVYLFYSKAIILEIRFRSKLFPNRKLLYSGWKGGFGFGDHITFCINIKNKLNKNARIFCYSDQQYENAFFFYEKKYLIKSIFSLPKLLSESGLGFRYLIKNKFFKPQKLMSPHNNKIDLTLNYGTKKQIKFILKRLNANNVSEKLKRVLKKKTIVISIKNFFYNQKDNIKINYQRRQTRNLKKIFKFINKVRREKINLIILGQNKDHFIRKIKQERILKNDNIFLFEDLSKNYSISDQVYLANTACGYVGSGTGSVIFFDSLVKKILLIDYVWVFSNNLYKKNRTYLYKKIYNKKTKKLEKFDWLKNYNDKKYKLIENSYEEIYRTFKLKFN